MSNQPSILELFKLNPDPSLESVELLIFELFKQEDTPKLDPQLTEILQISREHEDKMRKILEGVQELQYFLGKLNSVSDLERQVLTQLQTVLQNT